MTDNNDLKHMNLKEFSLFVILLGCLSALGTVVVLRLWRQLTSTDDAQEETSFEMKTLLQERQRLSDAEGMILLPRGC